MNNCPGCNTPCASYMKPRINFNGFDYDCPCQTCLIKSMCSVDCDELTDYFHMCTEIAVNSNLRKRIEYEKRELLDRDLKTDYVV